MFSIEGVLMSWLKNLLFASGRRDIGPAGTASRVLVGVVAIALPIALGGISLLEVGVALIALPLIAAAAGALVTAAYRRLAPGSLGCDAAVCSGPTCWVAAIMVAAAVLFSVLTPADGVVVFWVWLGSSMLLAAARGYGGCEVLAATNLLRGRRDQIGCIIFTPIDRAEAKRDRAHGTVGA
jgi:hypothetical protein